MKTPPPAVSSTTTPEGPEVDGAKVAQLQLDATFRRASPMHMAMPVLGGCAVWALWGMVTPPRLACWYILFCLAGLNSLRTRWVYTRSSPPLDKVPQWSRARAVMSVFNGAVFGLAGTLLFVPGNPEVQSLTLLLICGSVAATVTASSGHLPSLLAFLAFSMPPAGIRLLMERAPLQMAMGGFALVYAVVAAATGYNNNRLESRAIRLGLQNRRLVDELTQATFKLEESNQDLNLRVQERTAELETLLAQYRESQAQLSRSHEKLEERVAERTAQLERLQKELVRRNRELEDFAFAVSHDLKNELIGVRRILESVGPNAALLQEKIPVLLESSERSTEFVDRVLHLARVGRVIARQESVLLVPILAALFDRLRPPDDAAALVLPEAIPPVIGDPAALEQVFANLISNALEHRDPNKPAVRLEVHCRQDHGQVEIAFRDNGEGIAAEDLSRVFDTSFTSGKHGHFGFGLAIVKKIVEAHGGTVQADSTGPGQGAQFVVSLSAA